MTAVRKFSVFAGAFAGSKALVVFAPVVAAGSLSLADYGSLEWAIALATTLVPLVLMGLTAAVPYFVLHLKRPEVADATRAYGSYVALVGLTALVAGALIVGLVPALALGMAAAFASQALTSARHKAEGNVAVATIYDGGVYLCILAAALLGAGSSLAAYAVAIAGYLVFLCIKAAGTLDRERLAEALRYSVPLIIPSFAMLCLVNSGRALGGYVLPAEEMGMFGILFRVTAPAILVHQIFTTFYFRRIYAETDPRALDRYYVMILAGVAAVVLATFPLVAVFGRKYVPALKHAFVHPGFVCAYLWLGIQVTLWVALALMEAVLAREKHGSSQARIMAIALVGFLLLVTGLVLTHNTSMHAVIGAQALAFALAATLMIRRLGKAGVPLRGTQWCVAGLVGLMPLGLILN